MQSLSLSLYFPLSLVRLERKEKNKDSEIPLYFLFRRQLKCSRLSASILLLNSEGVALSFFLFFRRSYSQTIKGGENCSPLVIAFCIALKWAWRQGRHRKSPVIFPLDFSSDFSPWEFFPTLECPFCLWAGPQALQPPLKNTWKTYLEPFFFGKGNFASSVDFHFYKSHHSLFAQTWKIAHSPANLFGYFSKCSAQNKQNNMRAF